MYIPFLISSHNTSSNFVTLIPLQKFSSSRDCNINKKSCIFEIELGNSNQSNSHCLPSVFTLNFLPYKPTGPAS